MSDETAAPKSDAPVKRAFPVVGVGASAGGLAPTVELLANLGVEPGLAVVVIHHLDPTHESGLVDILSRATPMPVEIVRDGLRVEPNRVYVLPPSAGVLINQRILELVPRPDTAPHLPIDKFFESLALDLGVLAVGVILSGAGFDGTEGIKAIKREGGIGLAQDATAQYASMPESAIATGCVDFIMPATRLARELVRIGEHVPQALASIPREPPEGPDYAQILALVRKSTGIDFASYKRSTIRRRMQRRLLVRGVRELRQYAELLQREPEEIAALCEDVLIHVTGFFREPEVFEALRTAVFPKLLADRSPDLPLRIWVPGCSTGEEVYSIAMCLVEYLEDNHHAPIPIKIFGTDLSIATVEKARSGRYPESIEHEVSQGRLQRFFTEDLGAYQIRRDLRDLCVFAKHDVTRDPPFSGMDLVSCRNLMIYLGPELQDRVVAVFHYALREPGFLVLGTSETVRAFTGFTAVDGKNKIYARTSAAPRMVFDFAAPRLLSELAPPGLAATMSDRPVAARVSNAPEVYREADRLVLAAFGPPGVVVTDDLAIVQFRGQTGAFLEPAPGAASLDLFRLAREELRLPLRRALDKARAEKVPARVLAQVTAGGVARDVTVAAIPFSVHGARQHYFLVLFEDLPEPPHPAVEPAPRLTPDAQRDVVEGQLRQELASTRQYLESVIEQLEASNEELKAANEEVVSSNEELRSTNEELQSAKEELQATNEELLTLNQEMTERNVESTRLNDDLTNVLSSVELPILILGRDSRIRRFTPAAERAFALTMTDIGRAVSEVPSIAALSAALPKTIRDVVEQLRPAECAAQDQHGRWYQLSVRPYVTLRGQIDGTVITALDVDAVKRGAQRLSEARKYADSIVDTVRDGLVVIDAEGRIRSANKAFQQSFGMSAHAVDGKRFDELGRAQLARPGLKTALDSLHERHAFEGLRLEPVDGSPDGHTFVVNARAIEDTALVLLAFEDVTAIESAAKALERAEVGFRNVLLHAAEAVLMADATGRVVFANHAAAVLFGYDLAELTALSVDTLVPEAGREAHAGHRAEYAAAPQPREMGRNRDLVARRKDGTTVAVEVILSTVPSETGPLVAAFVSDITERRLAEHAIREYQQRLQAMAFDAARTEERERRRIAVDLHDRIGQSLALAQIKLTSVRDALTGAPRAAVDEAVRLLEQSDADTRTLTFELSPPVLYDLGLKAALAWLAEDVEKRHGIHIDVVDDDAPKPLDETSRALVFRAVRELVMNVTKHAKTAAARISLRRVNDHVDIAVEDSGVGFDTAAKSVSSATGGFGLISVREQIERLGGTMAIDSAPKHGTRINVCVPLQSSSPTGEKS